MLTDEGLPARLAAAMSAPRSAVPARARMSPELSYGRHAGPAPSTSRRAAVVLLLVRRAGIWHVPVTERPTELVRHGGQISLPGGIVEPGETSEQAALRELREELGVESPVTVLGQLADCYVFASNFLVTPWLAVAIEQPQWRPDAREVQRVIELPLAVLLDQSAAGIVAIQRGALKFQAPCYRFSGVCIWGATCVILSELADLLAETDGHHTR